MAWPVMKPFVFMNIVLFLIIDPLKSGIQTTVQWDLIPIPSKLTQFESLTE